MSVQIAVANRVAKIMINRPEVANAIDQPTRLELQQAWSRVRDDDEILVGIITGAGDKAFCAGSDLKKTFPGDSTAAQQIFGDSRGDSISAGLDAIDKPLIAAVNGFAIGGGMEIALACDIRLASENAQFGLSEVRVGSMPGSGGTQRLPRAIGMSNAMLMLLSGDRIDAHEAWRIGLVSKLTALEELMSSAVALAERIASNAPLSVRAVKRVVRQGLDMPLSHGLENERYAFGLLFDSEDRIEGRKAFSEKRKPVFKGC